MAKKVLTLAQEEAERSHHSYIGTEHLLLGLLREGEGLAAKVLNNLGVEINKVRATIESACRRWAADPILFRRLPAAPIARTATNCSRKPSAGARGMEARCESITSCASSVCIGFRKILRPRKAPTFAIASTSRTAVPYVVMTTSTNVAISSAFLRGK